MLRASLALMLLGASAAVLAQNGRGIANDASTSCQDLNDRAVAERTADALPAAPDAPDARRARATAVRNKYAAPAAVLSRPRAEVATTTRRHCRAVVVRSGTASCRACSADADGNTR